ncbi:MAG: DUF1957 domain-containing protein [Treponema sp.]|jgi:1,4-alpha-glucan branching enzyme|nr:DUF1957 domain-containing protein [Treponema sp.]
MNKPCLSIVINGHYPFTGSPGSLEERIFFEEVVETYVPLLELFTGLENSRVPFRLAMTLSPCLCAMFRHEKLMGRCSAWLDRRIDFGRRELERCAGDESLASLARYYLNRDLEKQTSLRDRYNMDLLEAFEGFQKRGRLEFLVSPATNAFLPFYVSMEEAVRAQIETALIHHRRYLGRIPPGFWLPELGWEASLGHCLSRYRFAYTIIDAHALILGIPPAEAGSFYPVRTPSGLVAFARDITAQKDMEELSTDRAGLYWGAFLDAGYELSSQELEPLVEAEGSRCSTGYRYWAPGPPGEGRRLYDPKKARDTAAGQARNFLDRRITRLEEAQGCLPAGGRALSLWVFDASTLGRSWHEGMAFLETLINENALRGRICLKTPSDYLSQAEPSSFQAVEMEFSSALEDGYGGMLLDASNDWIYRHIYRSVQRMIKITERFPGSTGLKERALNQAAREILLAQSTDLAKPLNPQWNRGPMGREYAEEELEGALRNFTAVYEALGSNHISTEWLTALEKKHFFLPYINYRVFGSKK